MGGFHVQRDEQILMNDAISAQQAGAFGLLIECIPSDISEKITQSLDIPTIGIGAGPQCDGQVLVINDLLGMPSEYTPKFVKAYADVKTQIEQGVGQYCQEVRDGRFPGPEHSFR